MLGIENTMWQINQNEEQELQIDTIVHYTNILTLLKILQNKSFKFNRIDKVNDLEEKDNLLVNENYRRVFVSCFSLDPEESIPMWKMYTQHNLGIMFKIKFKSDKKLIDLFKPTYAITNLGDMLKVGLSAMKSFPDEVCARLRAYKINYQTHKSQPTLNVIDENKVYNIPTNFAIEKSLPWQFEKEIRYQLLIDSWNAKKESELQDFDSIFLEINFDAIDKITIVCNPWTKAQEWKNIIMVIKENAKIPITIEYVESSLYDKIRL